MLFICKNNKYEMIEYVEYEIDWGDVVEWKWEWIKNSDENEWISKDEVDIILNCVEMEIIMIIDEELIVFYYDSFFILFEQKKQHSCHIYFYMQPTPRSI